MPPDVVDTTTFSPDIVESIRILAHHDVHHVIVGGEAVVFYGHVRFDTAWAHRLTVRLGTGDQAVDLHYIGLDDLIENTKAANRDKDRDDPRFLLASAEQRRHRAE